MPYENNILYHHNSRFGGLLLSVL